MIDDYSYARMDFLNDPYMVLPEVSQWRELGKKDILLSQCFCKRFQNIKFFYVFFNPMNNQKYIDHADVGPFHPPSMSLIQRRGEVAVVVGWDANDYEAIE